MIRKRQIFFRFVTVVFLALTILSLSACGRTQAQDKTYVVGVVNLSSNLDTTVKAFMEGLTELGYTEGENITYI